MVKGQGKPGLIVTIVVLALTLGVVSTIVVLQNMNKKATETTQAQPETTKSDTDTTTEDPSATTEKPSTPESTAVDPATLSSVDIEPMSITVFYTKGTPGFEFAVKRAADRTQYVEFSSPDLVGTKCTNDAGIFASIIENPSSDSQASLAKTVTVDEDTYGLSLSSKACTSDTALLDKYQAAFINGFGNLKEMDS